jgi:hypothetical protein
MFGILEKRKVRKRGTPQSQLATTSSCALSHLDSSPWKPLQLIFSTEMHDCAGADLLVGKNVIAVPRNLRLWRLCSLYR